MKDIATVAAVVCVCSVAVSLISTISPQGNMRKVVNLVIGAFLLCCMIFPIKTAMNGFEFNINTTPISNDLQNTAVDAYNNAIMSETKSSLETSMDAYLTQHGITPSEIVVNLEVNEKGGIYIGSVSIYISIQDSEKSDEIIALVREKFEVLPEIITR